MEFYLGLSRLVHCCTGCNKYIINLTFSYSHDLNATSWLWQIHRCSSSLCSFDEHKQLLTPPHCRACVCVCAHTHILSSLHCGQVLIIEAVHQQHRAVYSPHLQEDQPPHVLGSVTYMYLSCFITIVFVRRLVFCCNGDVSCQSRPAGVPISPLRGKGGSVKVRRWTADWD